MHREYSDITSLTDAQPIWHDENGVPRYCDFHPDKIACTDASEAALAEIECQACKTKFNVVFSELNQRHRLWSDTQNERLAFISDLISNRSLQYGDPPNVKCCATGPTMNSVAIEVLEYWVRPYIKVVKLGEPIRDPSLMNWKRDPNFELPIFKR